ncbi:MAG: hypothetical protein LLG20_14765 [Acidobacteriales bacterium]|nr:hypothetical protein [Terriglobales bacterium]
MAFRDQDDIINKGPVTWVAVSHGGYIHGLQLGYGDQEGRFYGYRDSELNFTKWQVPTGEHIVKAVGHTSGHYLSRLQFITDRGTRSPQFGGKQGKEFVTTNPANLPLRTITGWVNLRRHPSLNRACTSMTFHFSDEAPSNPSIAAVGNVRIIAEYLSTFYLNDKTYIFGRRGWHSDISNDASWCLINTPPKAGFTPIVQNAKMSSEYRVVRPFTLDGHPYIFGLHDGSGDNNANIWRIDDDGYGFKLVLEGGRMSPNYFDFDFVSFQLNGKPYLLGKHSPMGMSKSVGTNLWSINKDPKNPDKLILTLLQTLAIKSYNFEIFYVGQEPYLFALHEDTGANIWRIKDQPVRLELVTRGAPFHVGYRFVRAFQIGDDPYIFAATEGRRTSFDEPSVPSAPASKKDLALALLEVGLNVETFLFKSIFGIHENAIGAAHAVIWKVEHDSEPFKLTKVTTEAIPISGEYNDITPFKQGNAVYLFAVHKKKYADIFQVNENPPGYGFSLVYYGRRQ